VTRGIGVSALEWNLDHARHLPVETYVISNTRATRLTKNDNAGEVNFAAASTPTYQVFNGVTNMNRVYFRLRHQYQK
jgi:hypothetical protein